MSEFDKISGAGKPLPVVYPSTSYRMGSMGAPVTNGVQAPYGPFDFAIDAGWKFIGQPLYNIASGKLMQDVSAPRDQVPMSDDPREAMAMQEANRSNAAGALGAGMEAGGLASLGSFGAKAPAGALRSGPARPDAGLDMSQAELLQRAREMGFDTDQTWYHGARTGRIDKTDKRGVQEWFPITSSRETANNFAASSFGVPNENAAVFPLRLNNKNIFDYSNPQHVNRLKQAMDEKDAGKTGWWQVKNGEFDELEAIDPRYFEKAGFNGYKFVEEGKDAVAVDLNSGALRSVNAAFDPAKSGSANLLAANPFTGAVVPSYAAPKQDNKR